MDTETETVNVNLGKRSYQIVIGCELLPWMGDLCRELLPGDKCALIADSNVMSLYGERCALALGVGKYQVAQWQFPSGESSKNLQTLEQLYNFLTKKKLERSSFLVAMGGGVTGDLTGFAAATWLRGIPFVQVPTSLLAQVDSSVGGKTAVNLSGGKNLVGAFYQPRLVVCDIGLLKTLPKRELSCGLAEVIKSAMILDADFFAWLETHIKDALNYGTKSLTKIVERCCELKAQVTSEDETESGRRAILNFGHTIGHAIELVSGYGTYSHGEAIAIGQAIACNLSEELLGFPPADTIRLMNLLTQAGLPTYIYTKDVSQTIQQLIAALGNDKKTAGGIPRFVLAESVGKVRFGCTVPQKLLQEILAKFVQKNS